MGLAGPKESTKIGKDPRNTFWSKDTSRFGHTYLANLGWTPGQNLGDTTSSYHASGHITDASSKGVKIMLKDDNLGIGAKKGAQHDECTGLLGLQGLLGRLNGNTEQVAQVKNEEDRQKNDWIASKWGMKFVRGEIWVADDLTTLRAKVDKAKEDKEAALKAKEEAAVVKVKREEDEDSGQRKKRKRDDGEKQSSKKSSSKDKKSSKKESSGDETATTSTSKSSKSTSAVASEDESESQARRRKRSEEKEAKKERKEKRADKRTEKKERKDKRAEKRKQKKRKAGEDSDSSSESDVPSGRVTPASAMNGRHALRARFIAAKRSATMDATSLNEILMVRA